jgi:hypothetical protein
MKFHIQVANTISGELRFFDVDIQVDGKYCGLFCGESAHQISVDHPWCNCSQKDREFDTEAKKYYRTAECLNSAIPS